MAYSVVSYRSGFQCYRQKKGLLPRDFDESRYLPRGWSKVNFNDNLSSSTTLDDQSGVPSDQDLDVGDEGHRISSGKE